MTTNVVRSAWLTEQAILLPLNANVKYLNTQVMGEFLSHKNKSVDCKISDEEVVIYLVKLLNSLELLGMTPYLIMILRN